MQHVSRKVLLFLLLFSFLGIFLCTMPVNAAEKVKVKYNGKTYQNTSLKMPVRYEGKTVSKSAYKAIKINGSYMVPYTDVFRDGMKVSCSKKGKKITMKANNATLKLTVGSKTATLNGKSFKLSATPLSVKYVKKNKTKILVPVEDTAEKLGYTYYRSANDIQMYRPRTLQYDGKEILYHDIQGKLYYNHTEYKLTTLPVMKLEGKYYIPAQEVLEKILGLEYSYQASSGELTVENEDVQLTIQGTAGSDQLTVNGNKVAMGAPVRVVTDKSSNTAIVMIPAASFLKQAGYTRKWVKKNNQYTIQSQTFFQWEKTLTDSQKNDTAANYIYKMEGAYTESNGLGAVKLRISGSIPATMDTLTVKRDKAVITISMPASRYLLEKNQFANFGEIVDKMEITSGTDGTVSVTLTCKETADYSYMIQNGTLEINILYTYTSGDGSVTGYSLMLQKPSGVTEADVTNEDMYPKSKAFKIKIKGDYVDYFEKNPVVINNNTVKSVTVSKSGSNTVIRVKTSKLRGYKIYVKNNSIVVSMGEPKKIYKSIVVLDPGHGGTDPGAQNKGTNEKDLNFKIMYTLMKPYFSSNAPDIKAYWTRTTDTFITLPDRAAFAKKVGADVFISLHMNSASNKSANGTEVYYSVSNNSKSFAGLKSKSMATLFKNQLIGDLSTKNRGTKTAAYYVLKHNTVPSILIELGFLSGNVDYAKLTKASFQKKAAKSIYTGITGLFQKYPTGR